MGVSSMAAGRAETGRPLKFNQLGAQDLRDAFARGVDDWKSCHSETLVLCVIYPVAGILAGAMWAAPNLLPFLFPILAGFALLGPLATLWFSALSKAREERGEASAEAAGAVFDTERRQTIQGLAMVAVALYLAWIVAAGLIYETYFGGQAVKGLGFFITVLTTPNGQAMAVVGTLVGALFAVVMLGIGVISFPAALDRDIGVGGALLAAVQGMVRNPLVLFGWGGLVAALLVLGALPLLLGLAVVLPVLGHSTWHLYRAMTG
ncbi:DUF2189 domain-containing protein [Acidocella sp.]|uniref:DUF2189 domain-containing protein n=1 Tax=Acidocella sp. TaxID=50710 RepID=UPI00263786CE|nr:DUF2189 domain-containing protein [Acidocella sp.]